jgi:hypothetical protein
MAGFDEGARILEQEFRAEFIDTPVEYENVGEFLPPLSGQWCRFYIREEGSQQADMNPTNTKVRNWGRVVVQCFTPAYTGMAPLRIMADTVAAIFDRKKLQYVQCRVANVSIIGVSGNFRQANVTVPFFFDSMNGA